MDVFSGLNWTELLIATALVGFGALVQGAVGFGVGLLASPLLIFLDARLVPGPILLATFVLTVILAVRERGAIDVFGLKWALAGRVLGTIIAAFVLATLPPHDVTLLFGVLVLGAVALSAAGLRLPLSPSLLFGAGTVSGVMSTVASIGGPPMLIVYQHELGPRVRSTMAGFFLMGSVMSLVGLGAVGRLGREELWLTLVLLPGMLLGSALSPRVARFLDRGYTRMVILSVAGAAGAVLTARELTAKW